MNIVLSRDADLSIDGVTTVNSLEQAQQAAGNVEELMIIGGGSIYHTYLAMADTLYLTHIEADIDGDTQFPEWGEDWQLTHQSSYAKDQKNAYDMRFMILQRA